jgi:hypothetical protein
MSKRAPKGLAPAQTPGQAAAHPVRVRRDHGEDEGAPGQRRTARLASLLSGEGGEHGGQDPAQQRHLIGRPQARPRPIQGKE